VKGSRRYRLSRGLSSRRRRRRGRRRRRRRRRRSRSRRRSGLWRGYASARSRKGLRAHRRDERRRRRRGSGIVQRSILAEIEEELLVVATKGAPDQLRNALKGHILKQIIHIITAAHGHL
jgi:hypothetical protein